MIWDAAVIKSQYLCCKQDVIFLKKRADVMTDLLRETVRTKDKNFSLARIEMEMTTCHYYGTEAFVGVEEAAHLLEALTEKIQLGSIDTARLQNPIQIQ